MNGLPGWLDEWMSGCMNDQIDGLLDGWLDGWLDKWMNEWFDGWIEHWMNGRTILDKWTTGQMSRQLLTNIIICITHVHVCTCIWTDEPLYGCTCRWKYMYWMNG